MELHTAVDSYVKYGLVPVWWQAIILTQWNPDKILTFAKLSIQLYSMVKIIYPFLLVPLKSLIQVMACCQLDDKPFSELILKSMTPYHVSWAQKVAVC